MNRVNFGYSLKNILPPSEKEYTNLLIVQTEKFMKRIRWKLYFYKLQSKNNKLGKGSGDYSDKFGFKSMNTPPVDIDLKPFKDYLRRMVKNVKFRKSVNDSEIDKKMKQDVNRIKNDEIIVITADKNRNFYYVQTKDYDKLVRDNVTCT